MNEYLFDAIAGFVQEMGAEYERALNDYMSAWLRCLSDYVNKVQLAKAITEPGAMTRLDDMSSALSQLVSEANGLATPT